MDDETLSDSDRAVSTISRINPELLDKIRAEMREEIRESLKVEVRREMEEQLKTRWAIHEEMTIRDSVRLKERRLKNLKLIFIFYASLKDILADEKKSIVPSLNHPSLLKKAINQGPVTTTSVAATRMSVNKFLKFCNDFELIN